MNTLKIAKAVKEYLVELAVNGDLTTDLTQLSEYKLEDVINEVLSPEIKPQYFLFGEEAVMILDGKDGINKLANEIAYNNYTSYGTFKYTHNSSPVDLLDEVNGWASYAELTQEQYELIKNAEKEYIAFSDGHKFEKVSEAFAMKNWATMEIYGINVSEETEALIESLEDIKRFECFGIEITKK